MLLLFAGAVVVVVAVAARDPRAVDVSWSRAAVRREWAGRGDRRVGGREREAPVLPKESTGEGIRIGDAAREWAVASSSVQRGVGMGSEDRTRAAALRGGVDAAVDSL